MNGIYKGSKYRSIGNLVDALEPWLRRGDLVISDSWRNDEQAVGLLRPVEPGVTAFVHAYGQDEGRYGVQLDYPFLNEVGLSSVPISMENLSLGRMLEILLTHFELPLPAWSAGSKAA